MRLNSKRGQASIEMILLVLAVLLGGTLLSAELTKNAGSHDEISGIKKKVFAGAITSYIETNTVTGNFQAMESAVFENETDEENDTAIGGIKIIPGNGDSVEFVIICNNSNEQTIYFLNNGKGYGTSALYADVEKGFVGISNLIFHNGPLVQINSYDDFEGYATYIYFKTTGNTVYELEAVDFDDPIPFKIINYGGFGKFYITILDSDKAQEVTTDEENGNGNGKGKNNK